MKTAIHWFRRDFRLTDNTALNAAAAAAANVIPVYILSEWTQHHHWTGPNRQEFICDCLRVLAGDLKEIGGRLIIRHGAADDVLGKLAAETGAEAIFFNRDPDPFGRKVEGSVEAMGKACGVAVHAHKDIALHERDDLRAGSGNTYRAYAPYLKGWLKLPKPSVGPRLRKLHTPDAVRSEPLPTLAHWKIKSDGAKLIAAGEHAAQARLREFLGEDGTVAAGYADHRGTPAGQTTSRFSQDLRWGLLSIRDLYHWVRACADEGSPEVRNSLEKFSSELAWRDFYMQVLYHFPEVLKDAYTPVMRGLPWKWAKDDPEPFARWCEGRTGFPIVDAGMRQLNATGFMHNRLRMITSMFLTKDLRIHWRDGEAYFMRKLVDGEIASNNGGWQWSAGTGADAAPFFRIQNPWTQSEKFDPQGDYIHEWVPELRGVPFGRLHVPLATAGLRLENDYPPPMVDHSAERDRTLEMFHAHRAKHAAGKSALPAG